MKNACGASVKTEVPQVFCFLYKMAEHQKIKKPEPPDLLKNRDLCGTLNMF